MLRNRDVCVHLTDEHLWPLSSSTEIRRFPLLNMHSFPSFLFYSKYSDSKDSRFTGLKLTVLSSWQGSSTLSSFTRAGHPSLPRKRALPAQDSSHLRCCLALSPLGGWTQATGPGRFSKWAGRMGRPFWDPGHLSGLDSASGSLRGK